MNQSFSEIKEEIISTLKNFYSKVEIIENRFGFDLSEIKQKITNAIANIENKKFTIALFGAFSDGKSSILSALARRFDIKIAPSPTTDSISEYPYGDYLLIDTPGLFSQYLIHDEITKKKISEANVIIYTVDSVNPLKESQHPTIQWLLKDLAKADATIFVINKMDEIADLEDEEEYAKKCQIKKEVVREILKSILGYEYNPEIVCISADPYGLGVRKWIEERSKEYYAISRIKHLEDKVLTFIEKSKEDLIKMAGISVLADSFNLISNKLKAVVNLSEENLKVTSNQIDELKKELDSFRRKVSEKYGLIKEEIMNYRDEILLKLATVKNNDDLRSFYIREIGDDAYVVMNRLEIIINKHIEDLYIPVQTIVQRIENSIHFHQKVSSDISKELSQLAKIGSIIGEKLAHTSKQTIMNKLFAIRRSSELLKKLITFRTGGEAVKWAAKWATRLQNFGMILQKLHVFLVVLKEIKYFYDEYKFRNEKEKLRNEIDKFFKELIEEDFKREDFNEIFKDLFWNIEESIKDLESNRDWLEEIKNFAESVLNELKDILSEMNRKLLRKSPSGALD